jgi:hypothetical protein
MSCTGKKKEKRRDNVFFLVVGDNVKKIGS